MIRKIDFSDIYPIWKSYLWADRKSAIEPTSAMEYLGGYNSNNMLYDPIFFGYFVNDRLIGVNSSHICTGNNVRSRGLYVFPEYRKQGIATSLLLETINYAKNCNAVFVWSYPKQTSWRAYEKAGFVLCTPWEISELGFNAYCVKYL